MLNNNDCPICWYLYLICNKNTAINFLHYLNSHHNNMQFTIEFEQNCEIPFLEVVVKRKQNNSFSTSIYRKKSSLAFTLNATPLHLVSTRLISSAHFLIIVSTSVHQPLYYSLLLMMCGIFCPVMVTSRVSLLRTWIMFWTDTVTKQWYHHYSP